MNHATLDGIVDLRRKIGGREVFSDMADLQLGDAIFANDCDVGQADILIVMEQFGQEDAENAKIAVRGVG